MTYFAREAKLDKTRPRAGGHCGTLDTPVTLPANPNPGSGRKAAAGVQSGEVLRTFRLALAADGEFTASNGGTKAAAFDVVVAYVSRMNAVFKAELSVEFTLVSGTNLVYTDPATDPYSNEITSAMIDQNQTNVDAVIGTANYDVAHVLGYNPNASPGGIASTPAVCDPDVKARGLTIEGTHGDYSQLFQDQVLFHEMGHQFGMTHSYNSNLGVCNTREQTTSVEPGSGVTLMSYGFICYEQLPSTNSDDYFPSTTVGLLLHYHSVNYEQAINYMATISCNTSAPTNNAIPVVTVPAGYTIPKSTPFTLTGSASDVNNDPLTYSWEGTNVGEATPPDASVLTDTSKPPFFRSYEPVTTPARTYPLLSAILDGSNTARADKLPSVGIETTHRLTARDGKGGVSYGVVSVTVAGNSGPFLETTNLAGSYPGNSQQTITWSVNNTTAAPVNCANVDILLSTDGGLTFPTTLIANTPNDGSEIITLPAVLTSTARIKVASSNNIFFDISNANFSITGAAPDLTATIRVSPSTQYGNANFTVVVNVSELKSIATNGLITIKLNKDPMLGLTFDPTATLVGGRSVTNSAWSFNSSATDSYVLTTNQSIAGAGELSFGLSGSTATGATTGTWVISLVLMGGSGGEIIVTNNTSAGKVDYFEKF